MVKSLHRQKNVDELRHNALEQLSRIFGAEAQNPIKLILKDWSQDTETATQLDLQPLYFHPIYGLPHAFSNLWQGKIMLSSTEVANSFGGYLEGALEASEMALNNIINSNT